VLAIKKFHCLHPLLASKWAAEQLVRSACRADVLVRVFWSYWLTPSPRFPESLSCSYLRGIIALGVYVNENTVFPLIMAKEVIDNVVVALSKTSWHEVCQTVNVRSSAGMISHQAIGRVLNEVGFKLQPVTLSQLKDSLQSQPHNPLVPWMGVLEQCTVIPKVQNEHLEISHLEEEIRSTCENFVRRGIITTKSDVIVAPSSPLWTLIESVAELKQRTHQKEPTLVLFLKSDCPACRHVTRMLSRWPVELQAHFVHAPLPLRESMGIHDVPRGGMILPTFGLFESGELLCHFFGVKVFDQVKAALLDRLNRIK